MNFISFPPAISAVIFSSSVDEKTLRRVSERIRSGIDVSLETACAPNAGAALLFDGMAMESLSQILSIPATAYIDIALETLLREAIDTPSEPARSGDIAFGQGFCLSITTATVYAHDVSGPVIDKLSHTLGIVGDRQHDIRLSFQEAISNAALHGNLGLPSLCSTDMAAFENYTAQLKAALEDTSLTHIPVCIRATWDDDELVLSVRDHGQGFDTTVPRSLKDGGVCGRGIPLMCELSDDLSFEDHGRQVILRFSR